MHVSFPVLINVPSIPIFSGPFIMKGHFIFQKSFLHLLRSHVISALKSIYALYYIYWVPYTKLSLGPCNEIDLFVVDSVLNLFLNLVFK